MLIAEQLLLAALDPERGAAVNSSRQPLGVGLCGALVAELGLRGELDVVGKRFEPVTAQVPVQGSRGNEPLPELLRETRERLATVKARTSSAQLRKLDRALGGVWDRVLDGLVAAQILDRRKDRVAGLFPVTRHPVLQVGAQQEVIGRLQAAAAGDGELDPPTAVLLALSGPCRLLEVAAPDKATRGHAKRRIDEATSMTPVAPVVKKVIQEAQTAAVAAAAGGAVAASGGS
jgi:Golgi phosphoprotein 3 (GPP34)